MRERRPRPSLCPSSHPALTTNPLCHSATNRSSTHPRTNRRHRPRCLSHALLQTRVSRKESKQRIVFPGIQAEKAAASSRRLVACGLRTAHDGVVGGWRPAFTHPRTSQSRRARRPPVGVQAPGVRRVGAAHPESRKAGDGARLLHSSECRTGGPTRATARVDGGHTHRTRRDHRRSCRYDDGHGRAARLCEARPFRYPRPRPVPHHRGRSPCPSICFLYTEGRRLDRWARPSKDSIDHFRPRTLALLGTMPNCMDPLLMGVWG